MPKEVNFLLALEDRCNLHILYVYDKQTNAHFYICSNEPFGTYYSYLSFPSGTPAFLGFKEPFLQDSLLRERNDSVK